MSRRSVASRVYVVDPDLDAMVEVTHGSNHAAPPPGAGMQIIRDIEPYRAVGSDVASDGKRPVIGSRTRHREYLTDNGYQEVGNEALGQERKPTLSKEERIYDIKRAMGEYGSHIRD